MCIPEKSDDKPQNKPSDTPNNEDGDKKYREKKASKWEETLKRYKERFQKANQNDEDQKKRTKEEEEKDKKVRASPRFRPLDKPILTPFQKERIGKCLPLVAASMRKLQAHTSPLRPQS